LDEDDEPKSGLKTRFMSVFSKGDSSDEDEDDEDYDLTNVDLVIEEYEEDEDEEDEPQGLAGKIPFLSGLINSKKNIEDSDEEEDGATSATRTVALKKKRKFEIKPFHALFIFGIIIFALFYEEDEIVPPPAPIVKKKPIKKAPVKPEPVVKPEAKPIPEPEPEPIPEPEPEPIPEQEPEPIPEPEPEPIPESEPEPSIESDNMGESTGSTDTDSAGNLSSDQQVDNSVNNPDTEMGDSTTDITKKLLQDLEKRLQEEKKQQKLVEVLKPVAAPSYEAVGPSLVYNCSGQHWACIEPKAYTECRQNYSWNKKNGLPVECYPFGELDDNFDCATAQQEKIDRIGDTSFCN
jgi:hypothetical protein